MKVLSLKEPYATLISKGIKKIETRSWKTSYRGELYIHASSSKDYKNDNLDIAYNYVSKEELNHGYIICKCQLVDCIYMDQKYLDSIKGTLEEKLGVYAIGRYAWVLEDVEVLNVPIKAKGKLNIWEYKEGE